MSETRPFDGLEPDVVLGAVESFGQVCDGHLLVLNSYENRVYQVGIEDAAPVIAKFYRPARWSDAAILEEHAFALELSDLEIPVVPPSLDEAGATLREYEGFRVAIYERRAGSWPEMLDAGRRRWMGRLVGRIHAVGATRKFIHRPSLDPTSFGVEPRQFLLTSEHVAPGSRNRYEQVSGELLTLVQAAFLEVPPDRFIRVHGDCHGGNILWRDEGPVFVDLDDARMAPAVQDLWMFLEGSPDERQGQLMDLLEGYEDFRDFDYRELRLIEALRGLRLMHYAAWLARRWSDPAFPLAFPWFGSENYWEQHIQNLQEQSDILGQAAAESWSVH